MKKEYSNIEDLFKETFDGYKVEPSTSTWKSINGKLNLKQFLSPGLKHFNVYYLSAIIGIAAVIGALLSNNEQLKTTETKLTTPNKTEISIENNAEIIEDLAKNNATKETSDIKHTRIQQRIKKSNTIIESSKVSEVIPITQNQKLEKISDGSTDSMSELNKIAVLPPKPLFKLNNKQGCAPFKIKLDNYTELAQSFEWTFGDGSKSKDKNPVHTYRYPGVYTISLKASGLGGVAYSVIDSIVVHEGVDNKVAYSFNSKLTEDEPFVISVKSSQNADYEWNFGDGTYSTQPNPTHAYSKEGHYSISLITLTENNCYDSVKVADAVVLKSNKKIVFPNAFCPNPNGPSEGKYKENDLNNNIFHPVVKGQLMEYNLKIFAKSGLLIFESNNVKIGWDGYFQNRLLPSGVYPYIVTVKFEGDNKPTQQRGNLTILHKR
jgi:gliding motility-associated-like protein